MSIPYLDLHQVNRDYPGTDGPPLSVLRGVDLAIYRGETLAIIGPSGSGKSTLLSVMAGLDRPTSGTLSIDGAPTTNWTEDQFAAWRRAKLGFVFQDYRLLPRLTAEENVALPLELLGQSWTDARARARELLNSLGLGARLSHRPDMLSGGEKQRVAIARAYAHNPVLMLADEPTGTLDPETSNDVIGLLLALNADHGTALVTVTHDREVAARMNRCVRISDGQTVPA